MAIKIFKVNKLVYYIALLGLSWSLVACASDNLPEVQDNNSQSTPPVEETAFVSPISPVSPISESVLSTATPFASPTPRATYVLEINPVATLAGEVTLDGKKLYYVTTPVYDPLTLTGLAADDQHLWIINNETDSFLGLDPQTGETTTVLPFPETVGPEPNLLGLARDGETFWLAEANTKTIYQYNADFTDQLNSFPITNYPGGIAWDGQSLWVINRETAEIQNWSAGGELLKTYTVPGTELTGVAWGAERVWYLDAAERVVRYWDPASSSTKVVITDALAPQSFGSLSWKENSLLLLDDMGGRLLSFDIDEFKFIR